MTAPAERRTSNLIYDCVCESFIHGYVSETADIDLGFGTEHRLGPEQLLNLLIYHPEAIVDKESVLSYFILSDQEINQQMKVVKPLVWHYENSVKLREMRNIENPISYSREIDMSVTNPISFASLCAYFVPIAEGTQPTHAGCADLEAFFERQKLEMFFTVPLPELRISDRNFTGLMITNTVNVSGVASTGNFVFVLGHDMTLNVFPVLENGALLPGFSRNLNLDPSSTASLSVTTASIVVADGDRQYSFDLHDAITKRDCPLEYRAMKYVKSPTWDYTDGFVNVSIESSLLVHITTIESSSEVHSVKLRLSDDPESRNIVANLFQSLQSCPVEVNGCFLSIFRRLDDDRLEWIQFSLLTGEYVGKQIINTQTKMEAITHDSINRLHWVVTRENGRLFLVAYHSVGSMNPFLFGFQYNERLFRAYGRHGKVFARVSLLLLSTLGICPMPCFILPERGNVKVLLSMVPFLRDLLVSSQSKTVESVRHAFLILTLILESNIRFCAENIREMGLMSDLEGHLASLLEHVKDALGPDTKAFMIMSLFEHLDWSRLGGEIASVVEEAHPVVFLAILSRIAKSGKLVNVSIHQPNGFSNLLGWSLPDLSRNAVALLMTYQRVLVRETAKQLQNDMFSSIRLFDKSALKETAIDSLGSYTELIVNQVVAIFGSNQSVSELMKSPVMALFKNHAMLLWSLSSYHTVSQIVLPMISVLPLTVHSFMQRLASDGVNVFLSDLMTMLGFTFGLFAGTLIKGGDVSTIESKYQWLIRPNMSFMGKRQELDQLISSSDDFDDPFVASFVSEDNSIMPVLYRSWRSAMHGRLTDEMKKLDRFSLISMCASLDMISELRFVRPGQPVNQELKLVLDQMLRIRNSAIAQIRQGHSIMHYFTKCRMLLRMAVDLSESTNKAKTIADFIVSQDRPVFITKFIANQQIRVTLTTIGFSVVESLYAKNLGSVFEMAASFSLSQIKDFKGLTAILRYSEGRAVKHIIEFVQKVVAGKSPFLLRLAQKLLASGVIPRKETEEILAPIAAKLKNNVVDRKAFALCYSTVGTIFAGECDVTAMTPQEFCLFTNGLETSTCSLPLFHQLLNYSLRSGPDNCTLVVPALRRMLRVMKPRPRTLKNDLNLIFDTIGQNIAAQKYWELTSEYLGLFRELLAFSNELTLIVMEILRSVTPESPENKLIALFAVLGGFFEKARDNSAAVVQMSDEVMHVVMVGEAGHVAVETPVRSDTTEIDISSSEYYGAPVVEFTPLMFPDAAFIFSFFDRATADIFSPLAASYLMSLNYYLKDPDFACYLESDTAARMAKRLAALMNPVDNISHTISSIHKEISKPEIECQNGFEVLFSKAKQFKTYLSPPLRRVSKIVHVTITSDRVFSGFIGLLVDSFAHTKEYLLIDIPGGIVFPSYETVPVSPGANSVVFSVDLSTAALTLGNSVVPFPVKCSAPNLKIVVASHSSHELRMEMSNSSVVVDDNPTLEPMITGFDYRTKSRSLDIRERIRRQFQQAALNQRTFGELSRDMTKAPSFSPVVQNSGEDILFPAPDIPISFSSSDEMSRGVKELAGKHLFSYLYGQLSTVIAMRLVLNGFADSFAMPDLVQLFSLLTIALEPCALTGLSQKHIPFSFSKSILSRESDVNVLNFELDSDAHNCLTLIARQKGFNEALQIRVSEMNNSSNVHLLTGSSYDLVFYAPGMVSWPLVVNSDGDCDSFLGSVPLFNSVLAVTRNAPDRDGNYPLPQFIPGDRPIMRPVIARNVITPISFLKIHAHSNTWMLGTGFEMLILLREYYLRTNDSAFFRNVIAETLITQSPFLFAFQPDLMNAYGSTVLLPSDVNDDMKIYLVALTSFLKSSGIMNDLDFSWPILRALHMCTLDGFNELFPYFPEFIGRKEPIPPSKMCTLPIPDLDIPSCGVSDPIELCMMARVIFAASSLHGFPFWSVLPLWFAISEVMPVGDTNLREPRVVPDPAQNRYTVIAPPGLEYEIHLEPQRDISEYAHSIVLIATDKDFSDPLIFVGDQLRSSVNIPGGMCYISLVNIPGGFSGFSVRATSGPNTETRRSQITFDPTRIHDEFVSDIQTLIQNWNHACTETLVESLVGTALKSRSFEELMGTALSLTFEREIPRRVVVLVTCLIHRVNYIYAHQKEKVPSKLWETISYMIQSEGETRFLDGIRVSSNCGPSICIDRREARRLAADGNTRGNKMTLIAQFTREISSLSVNSLQARSPPWHVTFKNESAIDAGGPGRELFSEIAESIFHPTSDLFVLSPNGRHHCGGYRDCYVPSTSLGSKAKDQYKAIGQYLGMVIRTGFTQSLPFAPFVWDYLAGKKLSQSSILSVDNELKVQFQRLQEARGDPVLVQRLALPWSMEDWSGAQVRLKRSNDFVQAHEINEYMTLCIRKRMAPLQDALRAMQEGFYANLGIAQDYPMRGSLLSRLAQGSGVVTTAKLKAITRPQARDMRALGVFWAAVERMTDQQRSLLLRFCTTFCRLPNPSLLPDFHISLAFNDDDDTKLPYASTCFYRLYVPRYSTPEIAFRKITCAIEMCQTMENA